MVIAAAAALDADGEAVDGVVDGVKMARPPAPMPPGLPLTKGMPQTPRAETTATFESPLNPRLIPFRSHSSDFL